MSSDNLIKDIFTNYVGFGDVSKEYYMLSERIDVNTKMLNKVINNRHKKIFEKLCNDYEELNIIQSEDAFVRGFVFAVHLLSEAYAHKL